MTPPSSANGKLTASSAVSRNDRNSSQMSKQDAEEAEGAQEVELPLRLLQRGVLAKELGIIALLELQRFDPFLNVARNAAQIAGACDVHGYVDAARAILALDLVGRRHDSNIRDIADSNLRSGGGGYQHVSQRVQVAPHLRRSPDRDVVALLIAIDFADLVALDDGFGRAAHVAGREAISGERLGLRHDLDLRNEALLLDLQVGDALHPFDRCFYPFRGCAQLLHFRPDRSAPRRWRPRRSGPP